MQDGLAVAVVTMVMHGHKSLARYGAAGCAANAESEVKKKDSSYKNNQWTT
jgi:hypothetical protein